MLKYSEIGIKPQGYCTDQCKDSFGLKTIHNTEKYLTPELVKEVFEKGRITYVDKQLTGNGFTTAFSNINPGYNDQGSKQVLLLLEPNVATVRDKNDDHLNDGGFAIGKSVAAQFEGSKNPFRTGDDIILSVVDSFMMNIHFYLRMAKEGRISYILVDEIHSLESQALFRPRLKEFLYQIKKFIPYSKIAFVTATPHLFGKIDVTIENEFFTHITIHLKNDEIKALEDAKCNLEKGENVIIFTNEVGKIAYFKSNKGVLRCNLLIGEGLTKKLVGECQIDIDKGSKLTICSSSSHEGWSYMNQNAKIYFFENRKKKYTSFNIANLIQAINRPRLGAAYIEYIRIDKETKPKQQLNLSKNVKSFVANANKIDVKPHINGKNKDLLKYTRINYEEEEVLLEADDSHINLTKEKIIDDSVCFIMTHKNTFEKRKINYIDERNPVPKLSKYKSVNRKTRIKNLYINRNYIENRNDTSLKRRNLFDNRLLIELSEGWKELKNFVEAIDLYLERKNYKGDYKPEIRVLNARELFANPIQYNALINKILQSYERYYSRKLKNNQEELATKIQLFKDRHTSLIPRLIIQMCQELITGGKWMEHQVFRQYNIFTMVNMEVIHIVAQEIGIKVLELDIISCNPRIVHALTGKELPVNFYGKDKRNKAKINIALNKLWIDRDEPGRFRSRGIIKRRLINYGFDENIANWLINEFSDSKGKSDFFYKMAYHEQEIIKKLQSEFRLLTDEQNLLKGMARRHDSLLVFDLDDNFDLTWVNKFEYLNKVGWFKSPITQ